MSAAWLPTGVLCNNGGVVNVVYGLENWINGNIMSRVPNKIGFHYGSQSIATGWGEYIRELDAAGVPAVLMSTAGNGFGDIEACWDNGSLIPHLAVVRCMTHNDVPLYGADIETAVNEWLDRYVPKIGNDVKKYHQRVITKHGNELDRNYIEWLAEFYTALHPALLERMGWESHRICCFSFAGGNPDPGQWETILPFIKMAGENPDKFVIGLHEYSFDDNDIWAKDGGGNPLIGRFTWIYDICNERGWARPHIVSHEWGWRDTAIAQPTSQAMADIDSAMTFLANYPEYLGAGIWTLQEWQSSGINAKVQKLIEPVKELSLNKLYDVGKQPDPDPPVDPPLPEENMIKNWSFEDGWDDVPAGVGNLINQQPRDWNLYWEAIGNPLWAVNQKTGELPICATIPECLHKLNEQLPPSERVDGETPLILDGRTCYKVFARGGPWGVVLTPSFESGLLPSTAVRISVPVQIHYQDALNDDSPDDVEIWLTAGTGDGRVQREFYAIPDLPDHQWVTLEIEARTDADGRLPVGIRIQTKWANNRDVFMDAITAVYAQEPVEPPVEPPVGDCRGLPRVQYRRVVHVYPAEATPARAAEIAAYAFENGRQTVSGSYDDAMIGDLDYRLAILWDVSVSKLETMTDWAAYWYPGALIEFMNIIGDTPPPASGITSWPCDEFKVTQWFGRNPDSYPLWSGGHEGIDLVCPIGSPYYAAGDGIVIKVSDRRSDGSQSAYGWHVIIDHGDGLTTLYAHAKPAPPVAVGQRVTIGETIAISGNTGNSSGPHLHFTVKQEGAQTVGYPAGYVDPWAYLEPIARTWLADFGTSGWLWASSIDEQDDEYGRCLGALNMRLEPSVDGALRGIAPSLSIIGMFGDVVNGYIDCVAVVDAPPPITPPPSGGYEYNGRPVTYTPAIHAPADDWRWPVVDSMINELGIPVKFMSNGISADFYGRYSGRPFSLIRLMHNFSTYISPAELYSDGWRGEIGRFYSQGALDFELHNEPNLPSEGLGVVWQDGAEFGAYMREIALLIRADYPEARLWFPGMSPGVPWTNQFPFTQAAWAILEPYCYGFCMHAYTGNNSDAVTAVGEIVNQVLDLQEYMGLQVPLAVSECSVNRGTDYVQKAAVYQGIDASLFSVPGVQAAVWYISDWYSPPPEQAGHGESWYGTDMARLYKNG